MTLDDFLGLLRGVRKLTTGWEAFCPAHEDTKRKSLSVGTGRDGRILVTCHKACTLEQICAAVRITVRDLFPDKEPMPRRAPAERGRLVTTYDYVDEHHVLLYQVCRFEPKDFRPRRPDGQGGWTWSLGDVRRILYRYPDLVEHARVYLVEGEKDADALVALGLPATTSHGGVKGWRPEYVEQLRAIAVYEVIILPDNDEPGEEYAQVVAKACLSAGMRVKIVRLPDLPHKGDAFDWIAAGGMRPALEALVEEAPWLGATEAAATATVHLSTVLDELAASLQRGPTLALRTPYPALNALLSGGLSGGELVYIGAFAGVGKTAFMLELSRGAAHDNQPVMIFSREMVNLALARRLVAQELEMSARSLKRGVLNDAERADFLTLVPKMRTLPIWLNQVTTDVPGIEREIESFPAPPPLGLVVVDYLQLMDATGVSARPDQRRLQVEAVSKGLKGLAQRYRVPILCASSMSRPQVKKGGKATPRKPSVDLLRESGSLEHDADIVLLLHREFDSLDAQCIVAKNRDGRVGTVALKFKPESVAFEQATPGSEDTA
jgi:hypothetical protein